METEKGMRTIWFFVGVILLFIGFFVFLAGIYDLINPSNYVVKLKGLYTNIWWGLIIAAVGAVYVVKNKNKYINH